eukprot:SAG11_NODE_3918_length_2148_cov_8.073694_2_plen_54_part_00
MELAERSLDLYSAAAMAALARPALYLVMVRPPPPAIATGRAGPGINVILGTVM